MKIDNAGKGKVQLTLTGKEITLFLVLLHNEEMGMGREVELLQSQHTELQDAKEKLELLQQMGEKLTDVTNYSRPGLPPEMKAAEDEERDSDI